LAKFFKRKIFLGKVSSPFDWVFSSGVVFFFLFSWFFGLFYNMWTSFIETYHQLMRNVSCNVCC
jgi:hypothetical protein